MTIRQASHGVIPMRIGFLSDIHGNAIALKSCWKRLAQLLLAASALTGVLAESALRGAEAG